MTGIRDIIFVTGNLNKLKEVQMILAKNESDDDINLINKELDLEEIQELDLKEIALAKCKQAVSMLGPGHAVFVEDTALTFDELNGLPGAFIKWFVKSLGLNKIVKLLDPFENKGATAITTIAYADENGEYHVFQGFTKGRIVESRGPTNFGWDSIFEPFESNGKTYAEMEKLEKNSISHRGRAFDEFKQFLFK
ncbi:hypothetical protein KAFR_0E00280 [Kazachstania africana CBS 2517]|uniref:Inosine triphosphate pyrophosphatase n=1 Tax=Kazachstania africana (strain ATCC 22294 / BCRC 22015 / CBS 2517 / CECT 1963 / NBRC 1671 / NRRL Y-8276) TaxID=1071382 RepID=H2AUY2_KAZAF|nr:hypothetical protein KAFR_0E00280 [Kazachstania africana CBS 2517]CCF58182.1 hypothetical protein KAFR_0E00280 [Kazachstania africana CBS 2517]